MTILERTKAVEDLLASVKNHCMCLKLEIDPSYVRVLYPEGYFPNGVQCSLGIGKAEALRRVLEVMERHWKESLL